MQGKLKICVGGGSGFIGSHLAKRLKAEGHTVILADWKPIPAFYKQEELCHEYHQLDLSSLDHCLAVTKEADWVFNLAGEEPKDASVLYTNVMVGFNMLEAARRNKAKRFFSWSSDEVYSGPRKEADAWPAQPKGIEQLAMEKLCVHYQIDYGIQVRIARFHDIYGPGCSWKTARDDTPASLSRQAFASGKVEISAGVKKSFCYIDDCVEGIIRLMASEYSGPVNIGSEEVVELDSVAKIVLELAGKGVVISHKELKEEVKERKSDNTLIKQVLGWSPNTPLKDGIHKLHLWIKERIDDEKK